MNEPIADDALARRWHLSDWYRPSSSTAGPEAADVDDSGGGDGNAAHDGRAGSQPEVVLAPLWYRIVTGKSLGWRLRRVRNEIRWSRRRIARRALRWIQLHPEVRRAARDERLLRFIVDSVARKVSRSGPSAPLSRRGYRAIVAVANDVDLAAAGPLVEQVDLRVMGGPALEIEALDDGLVRATGPAGTHISLPPVDVRRWSPEVFQYRPSRWGVGLTGLPSGDDTRAVQARRFAANRASSVHVGAEDVRGPVESATQIAELLVGGMPISGTLSAEVGELIGPELAALITSVDDDTLLDEARREAFAVEIQRAASRRHGGRGWWSTMAAATDARVETTPSISVLLPSNRPGDIVEAAQRVAGQRNVQVQLVVGLHGSHMPATIDRAVRDAFPGDLVIHRIGDDANLGQVMNELTARADATLVSKWDDDDWYAPEHLDDLVRALESSGSMLVGKAAEFVYLEGLDLTVRRFEGGGHHVSTTIAGGTLLMERTDLVELGWAEVPRQVDRRLIDAVEAVGGQVYRTHGLGYVLRRRPPSVGEHTWAATDEYFLNQSTDQRPGLDLGFAGFGSGGSDA